MDFILWIIIGALAGWIAGQVMKGGGFGLLGNIGVGIVGSFIGGWLFGMLGIGAGNLISSLVAAVVGAIILLYIVRLVRR
ncbi:MAG: GlsB/YeaQ/YmgE family stress response membrane protein [Caldilinea sp. CFX5]|nr:GlsB/YeaQ/YmgE family stress response membrane protein [Caldilinea sp. CFX5]